MTKQRKYTWNIIRASIYIAPDIWANSPHSTFHGTTTEVKQHALELNQQLHPGIRERVRFTYQKQRKQNVRRKRTSL